MTTQHAPGPWVTDGSVNAENLDVINSEGRIAMIDDSRSTGWNVPTINANARLIAAAPELLEALKDAIEIIEGTGLDASIQRAAIAKALGN